MWTLPRLFLFASTLGLVWAKLQFRQTANVSTIVVPPYVVNYAPYVYLDVHEVYFPSDIQEQLTNTYPASENFSVIDSGPSNLTLDNISLLDSLPGNCSYADFDSCSVYLTSRINVSINPAWLYGVPPSNTYVTTGATSCAIIVNDHGNGVVDAFYMYFYAFNYGDVVGGQVLGNHVGDWEHTMLRFVNGQPTAMWFSIHSFGECYTYDAVSKHNGRPIVYSALGSHGSHPVPGTYTRVIEGIDVNDTSSAGALWDPTLSAYYYAYSPNGSAVVDLTGSNSTILAGGGAFTANTVETPIDWLYFLGRWGDQQYSDTDPRQVNFLNLSVAYKWVDGPTGPWDKQLARIDVCPSASGSSCVTTSTLPPISGMAAETSAIITVPTSFPGLNANAIGSGTTGPVSATPTKLDTSTTSSSSSSSESSTTTTSAITSSVTSVSATFSSVSKSSATGIVPRFHARVRSICLYFIGVTLLIIVW